MNFSAIWSNWPQLLNGLIITFELLICSLAFGLLFAILMAVASQIGTKWLKTPCKLITFTIRGTPLIVQMYLIYYGSGQSEWLRGSFLWAIFEQPFSCALIALSINTAAYTTELIRGAFLAIPTGEIEACKAVGMSRMIMFRYFILPRAMRIILPAYANEVIMVLKGTTLVSTITLMDLMGVIRQIINRNYAAIEYLLVAGVIYIIINFLIVTIFRHIEKKWNAYL